MKETDKGKILYYSISIILVLAYLLIMFRGSVYSGNDDAYYNYYISKDLAYYSRSDEFRNYREGTLLEYKASGNYRNQGRGWSPVDDEGTWCIGNESDFYIYVDDPDKSYELVISAIETFGYRNYINVNGEFLGDMVFNDENTAVVAVDSGLHEGLNRFSICTDDEVDDTNKNGMYGDYDGRFNMHVKSVILEGEM